MAFRFTARHATPQANRKAERRRKGVTVSSDIGVGEPQSNLKGKK
jgi:hypothetical protein